ncbi:META domain-containing protein [Methylolobus aquaticus]
MKRRVLFSLVACIGLLAAGGVAAATISGTATYRERIALPTDAAFDAVVEDVSRADAPSTGIGRIDLKPAGQVPIHFEIPYDESRVQAGHRYSVRARVTHEGRLLFTTTRMYPVLTPTSGGTVELMMERVSLTQDHKPDRSLANTYWKLTELNGGPVKVLPQQREPHLILQSEQQRLAGSGGCNRLLGSYTLQGASIAFGQVASTMMACVDGMEQETAFFRTLESVRAWKIRGDGLELLDDSGRVVARFVAVDLR